MTVRRILVVTNRVPYPLTDGGNLAMHAMITGYLQAGWKVYLLAMNTRRHFVSNVVLKTIYQESYEFETVDVDNDIKPYSLLKNFFLSKLPNHVERLQSGIMKRKLQSVLTSFKPDLVQIESVFLSDYLNIIRKNSSAPIILRVHNIEYEIWDKIAKGTINLLKRFYLKNLADRIKSYEEKVWRNYDVLLPITETDANKLRQAGVDKPFITVPFGINIAADTLQNSDEQWIAYHIGAMDWLPNLEGINWFLANAWPLIHQQNPEFRFYFAGRNMPESLKQAKIDGVTCIGEVEDANKFIADKKILIVPIRSGSGIRVKILEGMTAGKLVISTKAGIQGIDADPDRHFLLADDPSAFADAVSWALSNKDAALEISSRAEQLVKDRYSNEKIASMLTTQLSKIL